jgi:hypothetical protein
MKFSINSGYAEISQLTPDEFDVMLSIVESVDSRCFSSTSYDEESARWYSSDDFVLSLTTSQRLALKCLGARIRDVYNL